jgi:hypothetical protein
MTKGIPFRDPDDMLAGCQLIAASYANWGKECIPLPGKMFV